MFEKKHWWHTDQAVKVLKMLFAFVRDNGSIRGDYREKPVAVYDAEEIIG